MYNYLSNKNTKLARNGIFSFGIPAIKFCPARGTCAIGCYATQGFFNMPNVKRGQETRAKLTASSSFASTITAEIERRKVKTLRIHDSGDFYTLEYLNKWLDVIETNPNTKFYAYTKMIPLFIGRTLPKNFRVIFSYGGKFDHLINPNKDVHARVFSTHEERKKHKYSDASHNDTVALKNRLVGLVYHGANSRKWATQ